MAGRATAGRIPGLVCLDEPTRGMDRARKAELAAWAGELAAAGAAVVIATHEIEFAASFADRVLLLGDGGLIADGPPEEVLAGGWYFATEVARVLGASGTISPEQGAQILRRRLTGADEVPVEPEPAGWGWRAAPSAARPEGRRGGSDLR
jgi:energy-coupling factor transport system ATP-binding protein